jgi:erythromycin esterase-like protein
MRKSLLLFIFCLVLGFGRKADAQQMPFSKLLSDNRYALVVQNGEMSGPGAPLLKRLLGEAQFVAIGEEHGTREVPQFVWATCRAMAPGGLDAMAIEAGPLVTAKLQTGSL